MGVVTDIGPVIGRRRLSTSAGLSPRRCIQIALGLAWIVDGALQFQPFMYGRGFFTKIMDPLAQGQPAAIGHSITWMAHFAEPHWTIFNTLSALTQIAIGLGLLVPATLRLALAGSFAWAIVVWWFGEGFGLLLTGAASPLTGAPGAVILYALIGALVWPSDRARGASAAAEGPFGELGAKAVWAILWLVNARLWLLPANRAPNAIHDAIVGAAAAPVTALQTSVASPTAGHGSEIALWLAIVSIVIGLGVLTRRPVPFLAMGAGLSLAYWVVGQAFGGLSTGTATDFNSGLLFILLAAALVPWRRQSAPANSTAARLPALQ